MAKKSIVLHGHWDGDTYHRAPTFYEQARMEAASAKPQKLRYSCKKPADPRTWCQARIDTLDMAIHLARVQGHWQYVVKFSAEIERLQQQAQMRKERAA